MTTVTGIALNCSGEAIPGLAVVFIPKSAPLTAGGGITTKRSAVVTTDASGSFSISLVAGDYVVVLNTDPSTTFGISVSGTGTKPINEVVTTALTYTHIVPPANLWNKTLDFDTDPVLDGGLTINVISGAPVIRFRHGGTVRSAGVGTGGGGAVTTISISVPPGFLILPTTSPGAFAFAISYETSQMANNFLATPDNSTGAMSLRRIIIGDIPTGNIASTVCLGNDFRLSNARTPIGTQLIGGRIYVGDPNNQAEPVPMSGDATLTNSGELTIATDAVTYAKIQNISASKLLGRASASDGNAQEISIGTNLSFSGTTLNAAGDMFIERAAQIVIVGDYDVGAVAVTNGSPITPFTTDGDASFTSNAIPFIVAGRNGQLVILRNDGLGTLTLRDTNNATLPGSLLRLSELALAMGAGSSLALTYSTSENAWVQQYYQALVAANSIHSFTIASFPLSREVAASETPEDAPTYSATYKGFPTEAYVEVTGSPSNPGNTNMTPATGDPPLFIGPNTGGVWNKGVSVPTIVTATLHAVVGGVSREKVVEITYFNSRYAGFNAQDTVLSSSQIGGLGAMAPLDNLFNSGSKSGIAATTGTYVWYCYRSALGGVPLFGVNWKGDGNERAEFELLPSAVSHTNASDFTENFRLFRSVIAGISSLDGATITGTSTLALSNVEFSNRIYIGPHTSTTEITTANIRSLDDNSATGFSALRDVYTGTFTATATSGQYIWFCFQNSFGGPPTFTVGGWEGGFADMGVVEHTNDLGFVESYQTWRSDLDNLGTVTIVVT